MKPSYLIITISIIILSCNTRDITKTTTTDASPSITQNDVPISSQEKPDEKIEETITVNETNITAETNIGIGPIVSVTLEAIDKDMVAEGIDIFKTHCSACHKIEKKYIGPKMRGVINKRSPEWIMNFILNPEEMIIKDPIGIQLLAVYGAPMPNQYLNANQARALLEYLRTLPENE